MIGALLGGASAAAKGVGIDKRQSSGDRKKPKKFSNMGYFEQERYKDEMAKKLGIQGTEYRDSRGNTQTRRNDKALNAAIKNNFDYRTSAPHMDGVKGNGKFNDFTNYERAAVKLHKQAGNGGEYSSNKDITTVTNNLVNDAQRLLRDKIDSLSAINDEQTETAITPDEPYEPSDALVNAREVSDNWAKTYGPGGNLSPYKSNFKDMAFNPAEANPYRPTTDVNEFAQQNLAKYKGSVKDIFKFKPNIA